MATMSIPAQHAAGIFANRNLDGLEIGTLVVVVDRAKNLPNLRTMGKQNPYCAARLGKMALKTETDQRGGQTPKWDQELRFTVHESLDYQKLKVSVFNEEKKTDLVGETWVDLQDVLRRGGGQNDSWHELQNRGKYAGQIRIELTFYDLRPREEMQALEEKPAVPRSTPTQDHPTRAAGPREPRGNAMQQRESAHSTVGDFSDRLDAIPPPRQGLRSFHTPPRSMADLQHAQNSQRNDVPQDYEGSHDQLSPVDSSYPEVVDPHDAPHSPAGYDYPEVVDEPTDEFAFPDDPYALEAAHVDEDSDVQQQQQSRQPSQPTYTPYRNDRVQELSGARAGRPLPHAHSSPEISHDRRTGPPYRPSNTLPADAYNNPYSTPSRGYAPGPPRDVGPDAYHHAAPPPPPTHRKSAPEPHQTPQAVYANAEQHRPMPSHAPYSDPYTGQYGHRATQSYGGQTRHSPQYEPAPAVPRRHSANAYGEEESYEAYGDAHYDPHDQQHALENVYQSQQYAPPAQPELHHPTEPHPRQSYEPPRPVAHDQSPHHVSSSQGPQVVRPRAISPNAPKQRQAIRRKSINTTPDDGNMPFSPDSFDTYNPHVAAQTTTSKSRVPGGTPPHSHTHGSTLTDRQSPTAVPVPDPDSPIRDSRGKIIDPSDHLPASTHAPEPEKKGNDKLRTSITATVKTRFGPRDARPAVVSTTRTAGYSSPPTHTPSPLSNASTPPSSASLTPLQQREAMAAAARQRLQKRGPASGPGSSPLAPAAAGTLNTAGAPPPVPMKIPLDEPEQPAHYAGGADGLSAEMSRIDLGRSPLQSLEVRYGGVGGQRARRSRFGA